MPDHAKEYSFNVIEFTIRATESCFQEFECRKTLMKSWYWIECLQLCRYPCRGCISRNWMPISANERIFALLSDFWCKWLRIFSKWTAKGVIEIVNNEHHNELATRENVFGTILSHLIFRPITACAIWDKLQSIFGRRIEVRRSRSILVIIHSTEFKPLSTPSVSPDRVRYKWTSRSAVEVDIKNERFTVLLSRCR